MAIARSSITIICRWCWCWDILRPLDCIVLPLLAFHIIILFIALVTFVAVCREAVSSIRSHEDSLGCESVENCDQFSAVISEAGATRD